MELKIVPHSPKTKLHVCSLTGALRNTIYEYGGKITVAEAVGALEIVKHELLKDLLA